MNAPFAPQHVDEQRHARSFRVLEEQSRTAGAGDPVGDLGDLEHGVHFRGNAFELPFFFQARDELAQVLIGHAILPAMARAHGKQPHRLARFTGLEICACTDGRRVRAPLVPSARTCPAGDSPASASAQSLARKCGGTMNSLPNSNRSASLRARAGVVQW